MRCVVSPGEGGRESVKDGSMDLNGRKPTVQIASIGVEISFKALDKFGIYRIGIFSRIFIVNPRSGSPGIHVTPPAFEIA
jgi:hypothetical protein